MRDNSPELAQDHDRLHEAEVIVALKVMAFCLLKTKLFEGVACFRAWLGLLVAGCHL